MNVNWDKVLQLLKGNPGLLTKKVSSRILSRLSGAAGVPSGIKSLRRGGAEFECDFSYNPIIREMYFGAYEADVVDLMRRFLKPGDVYLDVGANIGYLAFIAASCVGKDGEVHCFEPVPEFYKRLERFKELNSDFHLILNPFALAQDEGEAVIYISNLSQPGWNTLLAESIPMRQRKYELKVPLKRLDEYIAQTISARISLIKIDVEGFEFQVLKGLKNFLKNPGGKNRPVLIVEVVPPLYEAQGFKPQKLFDTMAEFSYTAHRTYDLKTTTSAADIDDLVDIVFLPAGKNYR